MKKTLSTLSLIAILSMAVPAMAAPPPPGGPGGPQGGPHGGPGMGGPGGRPPMAAPAPRHRHHSGITIMTGLGARHSYWGYPYCDYRVGYYDGYYPVVYTRPCPPPPPPVGVHWSTGVHIGF